MPSNPFLLGSPEWYAFWEQNPPTIVDTPPEEEDYVPRRKKYYNETIADLWIAPQNHRKGEIGLEIECEGLNLFNTPIKWWNAVNDGSLRYYQSHAPVEYVLKEPLSRADLDKAFEYLSSRLASSSSVVVESPRTSVHVHINCQQLSIKQVINYILLYLIVEDFLVEWCGHDRIGNLFCLRAKDASYFIHMLVQGIRSDDYSLVTSNEYRYMSCNTASLKKFGSLEFRSLEGTVDFKLISNWVDLLLYIKKQSLTFDNPQEIIRYFDNVGVDGILEKILPESWYNEFKHHPEKTKIVWDNVRALREVAYAIPEWEKNEEPVKKKTKARKKVNLSSLEIHPEGWDVPVPIWIDEENV